MKSRDRILRRATVVVTLGLVLLAGCVTPTGGWRAPEPAACTDPGYVQLTRQQPDSLSERSWQLLQSLDRECAAARMYEADRGRSAWEHRAGRGWHHGAALGAGVMTAVMIAMMIRMW